MSELNELLQEDPDFMPFGDWEKTNDSGDAITNRQNYAEYVRGEYVNVGSYSPRIENEIRQATFEGALTDGVIAPDADETTINSLFTARGPSFEDKLRLIQQNNPHDDEAYLASIGYFTFKDYTSSDEVPDHLKQLGEERLAAAEATVEEGYQKALRIAVRNNEIPFAKITNADGEEEIISAPDLEGLDPIKGIEASRSAGVSMADANKIKSLFEVPVGYSEQYYKVKRYDEAANTIQEMMKANKRVASEVNRFASAIVYAEKKPEKSTTSTVMEGVRRAINDSGLLPKDSVFTDEEIEKAVTQIAFHTANANGQFKLYDDPAEASKNVRAVGYMAPLVHPAAMVNDDLFRASVTNNANLSDQQKKVLETQREPFLQQNFDRYNKILSQSGLSDEWLNAVQSGRVAGKDNATILREFTSDPDNFSELKDRAVGIGESIIDGLGTLVAAVPMMMGADWARDYMVNNIRDNANRREVANLFGVQYGMGQDIAETIAPMLIDIGATVLLSGPSLGFGGAAYLTAKQGARLTAKGLVKAAVSNTFKQLPKESAEMAAERIAAAGLIRASTAEAGKTGAMKAIQAYNGVVAKQIGNLSAMAIPAFNRSAGMTYAGVYSTLQDKGELTPEEMHDRALGAGLTAGTITAVITAGFSAFGRGGLEDAIIGGASRKQLKQVVARLAQVDDIPDEVFNKVVAKQLSESLKRFASGSFGKQVLKNSFDEGVEEGLDEFINGIVTDSATDETTPFLERLEQAGRAAIIGGVIGAGTPVVRSAINRIRSGGGGGRAAMAAAEVEFAKGVSEKLAASGSPVAAQTVYSILTAPRRIRGTIAPAILEASRRQQQEAAAPTEIEAEADFLSPLERAAANRMEQLSPEERKIQTDLNIQRIIANLNNNVSPDTVAQAIADERGQTMFDFMGDLQPNEVAKRSRKSRKTGEAKSPVAEQLELDFAAKKPAQESDQLDLGLDVPNSSQPKVVTKRTNAASQSNKKTRLADQLELDFNAEVVSEQDNHIDPNVGEVEVAAAPSPSEPVFDIDEFIDDELIGREVTAMTKLASLGYPVRMQRNALYGMPQRGKYPKGYLAGKADLLARKVGEMFPTWDSPTAIKASEVTGKDKVTYYDTKAKKVVRQRPKAFVDENGVGIFNNDPVSMKVLLDARIPVVIPADFTGTINPAFRTAESGDLVFINDIVTVNPETGRGFVSVLTKQDRVLSGEPNYRYYDDLASFIAIFNNKVRERTVPDPKGRDAQVTLDSIILDTDMLSAAASSGRPNSRFGDPSKAQATLRSLLKPRQGTLDQDFFEAAVPAFNMAVRKEVFLHELRLSLDKFGSLKDGEATPALNPKSIQPAIRELMARTKMEGADARVDVARVLAKVFGSDINPEAQPDLVIKNFIENVVFIRNTNMPTMREIGSRVGNAFAQQQRERSLAARKALFQTTDPNDLVQVQDDLDAFDPEKEAADNNFIPPTGDYGAVSFGEIRAVIEQATFDVADALDTDPELREAIDQMLRETVFKGNSAIDVTKFDSTDAFGMLASWMASGNYNTNPAAIRFQRQLRDGEYVSGEPLRRALKLMSLSSKTTDGDPSQDAEFVQSLRENLATSLGRPVSVREATDFMKSIGSAVQRLWSRSYVRAEQTIFARQQNDAEVERLGLRTGDPQSVINALKKIAATDADPNKKLLAKLLLENQNYIRQVEFSLDESPMPYAGMFIKASNGQPMVSINLDGHNGRGVADVLLHEYLHAFVSITVSTPNENLTTAQRTSLQRINGILDLARQSAADSGVTDPALMDGLENVNEFVAHFFTSIDYQSFMKALLPPQKQRGFFRRMIDALLDMFGMGRAKQQSYQEAFTDIVDLTRSAVVSAPMTPKGLANQIARPASQILNRASEVAAEARRILGTSVGADVPLTAADFQRHAELEARKDSLTPDELAEAEALVERAARAAGYTLERYHVTPATFTTFRTPSEFTDESGMRRLAESFEGENVIRVYIREGKTEDITNVEGLDADDKAQVRKYAKDKGLDSVTVDSNWGDAQDIIVINPNQIKSADPFTGVPLSQRFQTTSPDIRSSQVNAELNAAVDAATGQITPDTVRNEATAETSAQLTAKMKEVIEMVRRMVPMEFALEFNGEIPYAAAFYGDRILVNPARMASIIEGLDATSSRGIVESIMTEEAAHAASYNALTQAEIDEYVGSLKATDYDDIADAYYQSDEARAAAKERLRSEDANIVKREQENLAEEKLRMHAQKVTRGFTTEEDVAFWRSKPSLFKILSRYLKGFLNRYMAGRSVGSLNGRQRVVVQRMITEVRAVNAGYRMMPNMLSFDPNNPTGTLAQIASQMNLAVGEIEDQIIERQFGLATMVGVDPDFVKSQTVIGGEVGTRNPKTKDLKNTGFNPSMQVNLETMRQNPDVYRKNAILLTTYPIVARELRDSGKGDIVDRIRKFGNPVKKIEEQEMKQKELLSDLDAKIKIEVAKQKGVAKSRLRAFDIRVATEAAQESLAESGETDLRKLTGLPKLINQKVKLEEGLAKIRERKKKAAEKAKTALNKIALSDKQFSIEDADAVYDALITATESNLSTLMEMFPPAVIKLAKLWYDGANRIAQRLAKAANVSVEQASGVLAVFSPQKDWFMNVSLAERMMKFWTENQDAVFDDAMIARYMMRAGEPQIKDYDDNDNPIYQGKAVPEVDAEGLPVIDPITGRPKFKNWDTKAAEANLRKAALFIDQVRGKKFSELTEIQTEGMTKPMALSAVQARFIRMFSEVNDNPFFPVVTPDGRVGNASLSEKGKPISIAWGGYNTIEKAIRIMQSSGTPAEITQLVSNELGEKHKVRSFYNNIVAPMSDRGDVTMDTHAIAALLWRALSGASPEVTQNFGGAGTASDGALGLSGLYPAFAEAYRRAAANFDLLPREAQSITWEVVRILFPAKWKSNSKNVAAVNQVWEQYENGEINITEARERIFQLTPSGQGRTLAQAIAEAAKDGDGVGRPVWFNVRDGDADTRPVSGTDDQGQLSIRRGLRDVSLIDGGFTRTVGGVAGVVSEPTGKRGRAGTPTKIRATQIGYEQRTPSIYERSLSTDADAGRRFSEGIRRTYAEHPMGKAVEVKPDEFYNDPTNRIFLDDDGLTGVAVTSYGDLVSVFKHPTSKTKITGLLEEASQYAVTLDAFDINGFLPELYSRYGFRPAARVPFSREYAPEGWPYDLAGEPDVILMVKDVKGVSGLPEIGDAGFEAVRDQVPIFEDYDEAMAAQQAAKEKVAAALTPRVLPTQFGLGSETRQPQTITPRTQEEQTAFDKASSNKVMARNPQLAVAAVRMKNGEITVDEYADLVDALDPFVAKGADPIPTKGKIQQYIAPNKSGQVMLPIKSGKEVEFRIDIPTYNKSAAAGDPVYAVTAHEPVGETSTRVGKPISYVGVAMVKNPTFLTRAISGKGEAIDIAAGAGKFPLATVKGKYQPITELPADINDPNVWAEVGYNPIRSSQFIDVRSKNAVVGGDEAVMVGSRVFVKNPKMESRPTGIIGKDLRYTQFGGGSQLDADYLAAVEAGDMETAQRMVDAAAEAAGYDSGPLFHSRLSPFDRFTPYGKFMGVSGVSGIHLTDSEKMARRYLDRYAEFGWVDGKPNQKFKKEVIRVYAKIENPLEQDEPFETNLGLGSPLPDGYVSPVEQMGYDALIRNEAISKGGSVKHSQAKNAIRGKEFILTNPAAIKSADPVTYDANGNVIPLSQRFQPKSPDIRYTQFGGGSQLPAAFDADSIDYSAFIESLEMPVLEVGTYQSPSTMLDKLFRGELDPRIQRLKDQRDFFNKATFDLVRRYKAKLDAIIKKDFGGIEDAPVSLIQDAIGSTKGVVVPPDVMEQIEDGLTYDLEVIDMDDTLTSEDKAIAREIALARHKQEIADAEKAVAKEIRDRRDDALNELAKDSPELVRHIIQLRKLTDELSTKVTELYGFPPELKAKFDNQLGIYLTRTYRMFEEVGYGDRVLNDPAPAYEAKRQAAADFFEKQFIESEVARRIVGPNSVSRATAEAEARKALDAKSLNGRTLGQLMVEEFIKSYDNTGTALVNTNLSKSLKPFLDNVKMKRDLPKPIRDLLGEKGAEVGTDNLLRTLVTVGTMASNQSFLNHVRDIGRQSGWLLTAEELAAKRKTDYDTYGGYKQIRETVGSAYDPIGNLYGPPELVEAMRKTFSPDGMEFNKTTAEIAIQKTLGVAAKMSGGAMAAKTLGSIGFYIRNVVSNALFFAPAQGYFDLKSMAGNAYSEIWQNAVRDPNKIDAYRTKLISLGVIGDDINTNIMTAMLRGGENADNIESELDKLIDTAQKGMQPLTWLANRAQILSASVDAFYKIAYYENELRVLKEARAVDTGTLANKSDSELERMAAQKVLATAQSASQAPPLIRGVSKSGLGLLFAPFIRFKAEVPRIVLNTYRTAISEMSSRNPVLKVRGIKRFSGMTFMLGGISAISPAIASLVAGIGEDEDEALRSGLPEYLRNHTFFYFRRDNGQLQSWDFTFLNPFSIVADPAMRSLEHLFRGEPAEAASKFVQVALFDQYLDDQILSGAVQNLRDNNNPTTGRPIYDKQIDGVVGALTKSMFFVFKEAYQPSVMKRAIDSYRAVGADYTEFDDSPLGIALREFYPVKRHDVELDKSLRRYLADTREVYNRVVQRKNALFSKKAIEPEDVRELIESEIEDRLKLNEDIYRKLRGFEGLGLTPEQLYQITTGAGYGKSRMKLLFNKLMDRPVLNPEFIKKLTDPDNEQGLERLKTATDVLRATPRYILLEP